MIDDSLFFQERPMKTPLLVFLAILVPAVTGLAQTNIGIIKTLEGDVAVLRGENTLTAQTGKPLFISDTLVTRENSSAGIIFTDGTTFTIGSNTEFTISAYMYEPAADQFDFSLYLKKGAAIYNSGRIGRLAPEKVNLSTPRAVVGIRGTRFIINVE